MELTRSTTLEKTLRYNLFTSLDPWQIVVGVFLGAVPLFHSTAHTLSLLHHSLTCLEMFPFDFISEEFLNT